MTTLRHKNVRLKALTAALLALGWTHALATPAGLVEFAVGRVTAVGGDGRDRDLAKGSEVQSGDRVLTNDGRAQIRFTDGAFVSLAPNTDYLIKSYRYVGRPDGTEQGVFTLVKGAMRTVSGMVGRVNKSAYRLETPTATIGIRGTGGVIAILGDGGTLLTGTSGVWTLTNAAGTIEVRAGSTGYAGPGEERAPETIAQSAILPVPGIGERPMLVAGTVSQTQYAAADDIRPSGLPTGVEGVVPGAPALVRPLPGASDARRGASDGDVTRAARDSAADVGLASRGTGPSSAGGGTPAAGSGGSVPGSSGAAGGSDSGGSSSAGGSGSVSTGGGAGSGGAGGSSSSGTGSPSAGGGTPTAGSGGSVPGGSGAAGGSDSGGSSSAGGSGAGSGGAGGSSAGNTPPTSSGGTPPSTLPPASGGGSPPPSPAATPFGGVAYAYTDLAGSTRSSTGNDGRGRSGSGATGSYELNSFDTPAARVNGASSQVVDNAGSTDLIGWGRWIGHAALGGNGGAVRFGANGGLHYFTGTPTAANDMPRGQATYGFAGATRPTLGNEQLAPGVLENGRMVVDFDRARVGVQFDVRFPAANATYAVSTSGGIGDVGASQVQIQGAAFAGQGALAHNNADCAAGCTTQISGGFVGPQAAGAGFAYQIRGVQAPATNASAPGSLTTINGAAAFVK
jgi:hypothetical protein